MQRLANKLALVTGSSRGIGRAVAETLARDGAVVGVHYGKNADAAAKVAAGIKAAGGDAFTLGADLSKPGSAERLIEGLDAELARRGGRKLDILVNAAGIAPFVGLADTTEPILDEIFAVNVKAPFLLSKAAASRLSDGGRIVNFSTVVVRAPLPMVAAYSVLKAPIDTLTQVLATELGARNITVNAVAPGAIATDMAEFLNDEQGREFAKSKQALKRIGQAQDVADVVAFLASEEARWITGQVIEVSGGTAITF